MKNKSVPAFVLGLIGFLIDLGVIFYTYLILTLIFALVSANGGDNTIFFALISIQLIRLIICIVAFVFSFKNAKVAGILYLIAILTSIIIPLVILISGADATVFVFFIPSVFYLLSTIFSFVANAKFKKANAETKKETELSL